MASAWHTWPYMDGLSPRCAVNTWLIRTPVIFRYYLSAHCPPLDKVTQRVGYPKPPHTPTHPPQTGSGPAVRWGLSEQWTVDRARVETPSGSHVAQALSLTQHDSSSQGGTGGVPGLNLIPGSRTSSLPGPRGRAKQREQHRGSHLC